MPLSCTGWESARRLHLISALGLAILTLTACAASQPSVNEVTVTGSDYAFGVPRTLPPGPTAFSFENTGQVPHEMILVRLREGVSLPQLMEAAEGGQDPQEFTEGGVAILIASPGETTGSRTLVDLLPGRSYALVCNFRDGPDQPPHIALGMVAPIEVSAE
jgi:hypothetical protein